jgi:precorrin-6Y C5,15-methyltransferase (decarboxylating)
MSDSFIYVVGAGAERFRGMSADGLRWLINADFLAAGERHLEKVPGFKKDRFVIKNNLPELVEELRRRRYHQQCVVLASGDPLFYGIGTYLTEIFGPDAVRVIPIVSSMQLAFARAGTTWQDAALASVHGRELRPTLLPLLCQRKIGLFTQDGDSPAAVARFFLRFGLNHYEAVVGENLGGKEERVTRWSSLEELAGQRFAPLNYLILLRRTEGVLGSDQQPFRAMVPGVPDEAFVRPADQAEVMTRQEVRAVILAKLLGPSKAGDTFWDIGAGLGTVAVEVAVLRPGVEVVAVEKEPGRAAFLRQNRERFGAYNVRVVEGAAPEALADETEAPLAVFLGGSGGQLAPILDLVHARLRPGGRLVASFVTLEHFSEFLAGLRAWGWPAEVTEVHVSRSDALAGLTGLKPLRGVFVVAATRPEATDG